MKQRLSHWIVDAIAWAYALMGVKFLQHNMEPLSVARHLSLSVALSFLMFLCMSFLITSCKMALMYDRQTLMNIRVAVETFRCDICLPYPSSSSTYHPVYQCWLTCPGKGSVRENAESRVELLFGLDLLCGCCLLCQTGLGRCVNGVFAGAC